MGSDFIVDLRLILFTFTLRPQFLLIMFWRLRIREVLNLTRCSPFLKMIAVVVFGSYARGDFRESSDIDLFAVMGDGK